MGRSSWIGAVLFCSMFTLPALASGECAWVLWVVQGARVDHFYASYTSAKECIRELDVREQRLRSDGSVLMTRSAATSLNVTDKIKVSFSTTYQCLPDTLDPRGPKGK
jgi:hypothetical protein